MHGDSKLKVFKNIKFLGKTSNTWPNIYWEQMYIRLLNHVEKNCSKFINGLELLKEAHFQHFHPSLSCFQCFQITSSFHVLKVLYKTLFNFKCFSFFYSTYILYSYWKKISYCFISFNDILKIISNIWTEYETSGNSNLSLHIKVW